MDGERVVGIIDESDLLLRVQAEPARFSDTVDPAMVSALDTLKPDASLAELIAVFQRDHVAVVADGDGRFIGLITRIDLLNHLRQQL